MPTTENAPGLVRRSARVLLLGTDDCLLLFRGHLDPARPGAGHCWFTPGGSVQEGETLPEAAARELAEETGLRVAPDALGPLVARTSGYAELPWASGEFEDVFFLHRVAPYEVDTGGFREHERASITGHRWWPVDELAATAETVFPYGLPPLLADLRGGRTPAEPVRLPWHH
ncbi:NUDIX hydrolase [Streptomyces rimosus]|uniref:NUDIX hydrolase n=1 Tax=Streptomyces rimosus TaxID=1927 RepID=UPI0004C226BE|nr:NUDIX domain-containing protein [Streptomyces rimosus]